MPIQIRPAREADLPLLAQMNKQLIEDEGSRNLMSTAQLQQRMADWMQGKWQIDLLLEAEEIVGYAVYQSRQDEYQPQNALVYLRQFFIRRDRRSRGIGAAAVRQLVQTRFPANSRVIIEVLQSNPRGQAFWSKVGFRPYSMAMELENGELLIDNC